MFRGQFVHSIDAKGRISFPSRFRDGLDAGELRLVVTPALFDPCLHVYPLKAWEAFEERVAELPSLDPHIVHFRRRYVSAAVECELDKAHRKGLERHLATHAASRPRDHKHLAGCLHLVTSVPWHHLRSS